MSEPLTHDGLLRDLLDNYELGDAVDARIRAALAAERTRPVPPDGLDVKRLARALEALPPLPFGILSEKAIVEMDALPTAREWAAAIAREYEVQEAKLPLDSHENVEDDPTSSASGPYEGSY